MNSMQPLAASIIDFMGGKENVKNFSYSVKELNFEVKQEELVQKQHLSLMRGIQTTTNQATNFHITLENDTSSLVESFQELLKNEKKQSLGDKIIDIISGCFQPILGALCAAGMVQGLNSLFIFLKWYSQTDGLYIILHAIGNSLMFFMPVALGYTAAKKFGLEPMVGLVIGATLCYPTLQASNFENAKVLGTFLGSDYFLKFLNLPLVANNYTSTVIPVIIIVAFASQIQKIAKKIIPQLIASFFVPFTVLLISLPVGFLLIGPIITAVTNLLTTLFINLYDFSPIILGAVIGFSWQLLVIFGLHWSTTPILMINLTTLGYDPIMVASFGASFAQTGAVLGMYFKLKDEQLKSLCIPSVISGLCGITEPCIYSLTLPKKKPFIFSLIGAGISGVLVTVLKTKRYTLGGTGIFGYVSYIDPNTGDASGMVVVILASIVALLIGFLLTYFFWNDTEEEKTSLVN